MSRSSNFSSILSNDFIVCMDSAGGIGGLVTII